MTDNLNQKQNQSVGPGSLAGKLADDRQIGFFEAFSGESCVKVLVLAALFVGLNFWQLGIMKGLWDRDANWSHGYLIPLFSLYLLYSEWGNIASAKRGSTSLSAAIGLPLMLLGIFAVPFAKVLIGTDWICQLCMIPTLLGMVLYVGGPKILRYAWVPIVYLALAMPFPESLYQSIAYPLQEFAALCTEMVMRLFGADMRSVGGTEMVVTSLSGKQYPLAVVEACSGVRSLMAFVALSTAMAFIERRPLWQRIVLIGSSLPITVFCNVLRVVATSTMFLIDKEELGKGVMHEFMGMALLVPALLMLLGLAWLLKRMFVEEDEDEEMVPEGGE